MKHIRKFNEGIDTNDVEDILLELVDLGYKWMIETRTFSGDVLSKTISICIYQKDQKGFSPFTKEDCESISETIVRLVDYMKSIGYNPDGEEMTRQINRLINTKSITGKNSNISFTFRG